MTMRALRKPRRVLARIKRDAVRVRDRTAQRAVERVTRRHQPRTATERELVEVGIEVPDSTSQHFVLGSDAGDTRITFLADIREPDALPPNEFERVILARPFHGALGSIAATNVAGTVRPNGSVIAIIPRGRDRFFEGEGYQLVDSKRFGPWRVAVLSRS